MGWGFFSKIGHSISHVANTVVHYTTHNPVTRGISHAINSVHHFGSSVGHAVGHTIHNIGSGTKRIVNTIYHDGKSFVSGAAKLPKELIQTGGKALGAVGKSISGILSSPLVLVGGAVAVFVILQNRRN